MIASIVAPILWLGAFERLYRWQINRNAPAGGALLTAVALALMVTVDTPLATDLLVSVGLSLSETATARRLLLLVACVGALVFALALDGQMSRRRIATRILPVLVTAVLVIVNMVVNLRNVSEPPLQNEVLGTAVETVLVYVCLMVTALVVAVSSWRTSRRTQFRRPQLRILTCGGVLFAIVAAANVIAGGILLQRVQVGVWVLRINRLLLDAGFASWALVLMASWAGGALIATREWLRFRAAYDQVRSIFPDLGVVTKVDLSFCWVEAVEARATAVLDGWALLVRPGDGMHADATHSDRAAAVAQWLDQRAPHSSITAADLVPPPRWSATRWVSLVMSRAQHTTSPLMERVR